MRTSPRQWSHKVAGKLRLAARFLAPDSGEPIVLMYHGVIADAGHTAGVGDHKHVGESLFRKQLELLAAHRRVVALSTLIEGLLGGGDCRGIVAITFDDGYLNNAECAARVLQEYSMSATFFLATGFIGVQRWAWTDRIEFVVATAEEQEASIRLSDRAEGTHGGISRVRLGPRHERGALLARLKAELKYLDWRLAEERVRELASILGVCDAAPHGQYRFMTWDHARALVKSGFEVGAHTVNHAILSRVPLSTAEEEILGSRDRIRVETGKCCPTFCYPNGRATDFTRGVMEICSRYFDAALSAIPGTARREDRFELRRLGVDQGTPVERLAARLLEGI